MSRLVEGVVYDRGSKGYVVAVILSPDEAEGIADRLSDNDRGGDDMRRWAAEARALNGELK